MGAKYHISGDGTPRVCSAAEGNCPLGADEKHFSTKVEARAAYEARQDVATIAPSMKKKLSREEQRAAAEAKGPVDYETYIPDREFEMVEQNIEISKIKAGDQVFTANGTYQVLEVKKGFKNATIKVKSLANEKTKTLVWPLTDVVDGSVKQETEASKDAQRIAYIERGLERSLKDYEPKRAKALADISMGHQRGHVTRSYEIQSLLEAEASDNVMAIYEHAVDSVKTAAIEKRPGYEKVTNPYTRAYEEIKNQFTSEILRQTERGGNNSTSSMSNLVDSEFLAAKAKFLEGVRWF